MAEALCSRRFCFLGSSSSDLIAKMIAANRHCWFKLDQSPALVLCQRAASEHNKYLSAHPNSLSAVLRCAAYQYSPSLPPPRSHHTSSSARAPSSFLPLILTLCIIERLLNPNLDNPISSWIQILIQILS